MAQKFKHYIPGTLQKGDEIWLKDYITEEYSRFTFMEDRDEAQFGQQQVVIALGDRWKAVPVFTVFVEDK